MLHSSSSLHVVRLHLLENLKAVMHESESEFHRKTRSIHIVGASLMAKD